MSDILDDLLGDRAYGDPDAEPHEIRMPYLVPGIVANRNDPLGLGRVTARVEGLFDNGTDWLTPLTGGGGVPNRGFFNPPRQNAVISVFFPLGRIGPGFYRAGGWAKKSEVPSGALVDGNYNRAVFEDDQWLITIDDRPGHGMVEVRHKSKGNYFQAKEDGSITVHADAGKLQSSATEAMVFGDALNSYIASLVTKLNTHTHVGVTVGVGVTGATVPGFFVNPTGILSSLWKVG